MENVIKVPVKPIIKQFLISRLGDPYPVHLSPDYAYAVYGALTPHFEQRYRIDSTAHDDLVNLNVKVSNTYKNCYVDGTKALMLSTHIEKIFWKDVKIDILSYMNIQQNKSFAMRKFYEDNNITEEIYSQDNFYRQITRMRIGNDRKSTNLKRQKFNAVSNADAREISRLYHKEKISCRQIANHFGIHHSTVSKIVKKVKINICELS